MCDLIEEGHVPEEPFPWSEDVYNTIANDDPKITGIIGGIGMTLYVYMILCVSIPPSLDWKVLL
jgi:hypothetical protein